MSRRHPQETRNFLATLRLRLNRAKRSNVSPLEWSQITDVSQRHLSFFVMYLLQIGCGVAWCPECQQAYPANRLSAHQWRRLAFGGETMLCPDQHIVYSVTSKIGSATDNDDVMIYSPLEDE